MSRLAPPQAVVEQLAALFRRNGYVRRQDPRRRARDGYWGYKKGDEVRLVANSAAELRRIRMLLRRAGFTPGRPFAKGRQWRLPLYGREVVARFLALIEGTRAETAAAPNGGSGAGS